MCPGFQRFPLKAFDWMGDKNCPLGPNTKRALTAQKPFFGQKAAKHFLFNSERFCVFIALEKSSFSCKRDFLAQYLMWWVSWLAGSVGGLIVLTPPATPLSYQLSTRAQRKRLSASWRSPCLLKPRINWLKAPQTTCQSVT